MLDTINQIAKTHPDISLIWNIWPLTILVWTPVRVFLNGLFFLLYFWVWWWPFLWNLLLETGVAFNTSYYFLLFLVVQFPLWLLGPFYFVFWLFEWFLYLMAAWLTTSVPTQVVWFFAALGIFFEILQYYFDTTEYSTYDPSLS